MLPRKLKLRSRRVFQASMMRGQRLAWGQWVTLIALPLPSQAADVHTQLPPSPYPQLGVVVSKKLAKQAVKRNRIRRQISALLAHHWPEFNTMLGSHWRSLIAVVRPVALGCTFAELSQDMAEVVARLKQRQMPRLPASSSSVGE